MRMMYTYYIRFGGKSASDGWLEPKLFTLRVQQNILKKNVSILIILQRDPLNISHS